MMLKLSTALVGCLLSHVSATATITACAGNFDCNVDGYGNKAFTVDQTQRYLSTDDATTQRRKCCKNVCKGGKTAADGTKKKCSADGCIKNYKFVAASGTCTKCNANEGTDDAGTHVACKTECHKVMADASNLDCSSMTGAPNLGVDAFAVDDKLLVDATAANTNAKKKVACCKVQTCVATPIARNPVTNTNDKMCANTGCKPQFGWAATAGGQTLTGGGSCMTKCAAGTQGGVQTTCATQHACSAVSGGTCDGAMWWGNTWCDQLASAGTTANCKTACCIQCHFSCKTCKKDGKCSTCQDMYFKFGGSGDDLDCLSCDPSCKTCDKDTYTHATHKCRTCKDTYFGAESTANVGSSKAKQCTKCHDTCAKCSGAGAEKCTECKTNGHLIDAKTGAGKCVAECPAGKQKKGTTHCEKKSSATKWAMPSLAMISAVMLHLTS